MLAKDQKMLMIKIEPFLILATCFIAIVLSINKIIDLAKPSITTNISKLESEQFKYVASLSNIQNSSPIDYTKFESMLSASFPNQPTLQTKYNIDPQIQELPKTEQNYLIRLKIAEWKIEELQNQIVKISNTQPESLIFNILFWICSLIIWIASTVGSQILSFYTDKFIRKHLKP